jgi:hypothetical protein
MRDKWKKIINWKHEMLKRNVWMAVVKETKA